MKSSRPENGQAPDPRGGGTPPPLRRLRPGKGRPDRSKTMFPDLTRDDVFRLETGRLWLRWPRQADAPAILRLAGEKAVAEMTARVPHPLRARDAEEFILKARQENADGVALSLAIAPKGDPNALIGAVRISP